jgi:hypothetical protein
MTGGGGTILTISRPPHTLVPENSAWQARFKARSPVPSLKVAAVYPANRIVGGGGALATRRFPSASSGRLPTATVPATLWTAGRFPTLTTPLTGWTAGKFVTSTCVGFAGAASMTVPSGFRIFRSTGVTLRKEAAVTQIRTMPKRTTFRMVSLRWDCLWCDKGTSGGPGGATGAEVWGNGLAPEHSGKTKGQKSEEPEGRNPPGSSIPPAVGHRPFAQR